MKILYWSRIPGKFVKKDSGDEIKGPVWTGNIQEWYETLQETICDAIDGYRIGSEPTSFITIRIPEDAAVILQCSVCFRPNPYYSEPKNITLLAGMTRGMSVVLGPELKDEIYIHKWEKLVAIIKILDMGP